MVRIDFPDTVELKCPACRRSITTDAGLLNGVESLNCTFCSASYRPYDALSGRLRRIIYHAVRDELERRIYEQRAMDHPDYFEDKGNILPG